MGKEAFLAGAAKQRTLHRRWPAIATRIIKQLLGNEEATGCVFEFVTPIDSCLRPLSEFLE